MKRDDRDVAEGRSSERTYTVVYMYMITNGHDLGEHDGILGGWPRESSRVRRLTKTVLNKGMEDEHIGEEGVYARDRYVVVRDSCEPR